MTVIPAKRAMYEPPKDSLIAYSHPSKIREYYEYAERYEEG